MVLSRCQPVDGLVVVPLRRRYIDFSRECRVRVSKGEQTGPSSRIHCFLSYPDVTVPFFQQIPHRERSRGEDINRGCNYEKERETAQLKSAWLATIIANTLIIEIK